MAAYSFIDNINDFFSTGYFTEDFQKKVFDKSGYSQEGIKELCTRFSALRQQYNRYKQAVTSRYAREKDKERETFDFNSKLLECLGYYKATVKEQPAVILSLPIGENGAQQYVPVRIVCNRTDGSPQLYVMDIPTLVSASDDTDAETGFAELGLDRLVTHIFSLPEQEHPRYILMSSGNMVFFMDADKWERGAYLRFDIERLLVETTQSAMRNYFALFYLLVSREALAAIGDTPLMQQLEEESYKNAYAVTQDLKRGVVAAVEALANEAIWYIKHTPDNKFHDQDETDDNFETMMRDDCLVFIYRLLFIFYAESRPDLDILPINDQTYQRGYSLEMLRDLEQVNLITAEELNGYFFDHSIKRLFALILRGYNEDRVDASSMTASFRVRHIDSPLFSDTKLKVLVGVKFRNVVWQSIVCQLSLSQKQKGKPRGRIQDLVKSYFSITDHTLRAQRRQQIDKYVKDYIKICAEGNHEVQDAVDKLEIPNDQFFLWHTYFADVFEQGGFDIVIGNPPYVNVEGISVEDKKIYKDTFTCFEKRADLFSLFLEMALTKLASASAVVTYIIPSIIHSNLSYKKLRNLFLDNKWLSEVCYTGGKVFHAPTVDTTILRFCKRGNKKIILKNAVDFENQQVSSVPSDYFSLFQNLISISDQKTNDLMGKLFNHDFPRLDENFSVFQGIVTGNNPAFIFDSEAEALSNGIDKELLHPLCHGRDIERYAVRSRERRILYLNNSVNIETYPNTETWLAAFKDALAKRREAKNGAIQWYSLQWPRVKSELDLKEKIWIQRTRNESLKIRIVATLDEQGCYTSEGMLNIIPKQKKLSLRYLLGILDSSLLNYLFATKFLNLAVKGEYLKQLRIPVSCAATKNQLEALVSEILELKKVNISADTTALENQIDFLVYHLYGLTYDEVLIVDPETPISREEYEAYNIEQ